MKMKKIGALVLALVMALSLTVTAFADTITSVASGSNSASTEVKGKFEMAEGTTVSSDKKYKVDIAWGDMQFTYTMTSTSTTALVWDPETHTYKGDEGSTTSGAWTCSANGNKVTLTNHSNAKMKAAFTFTAEDRAGGITASMKDTNATGAQTITEGYIATAVGTDTTNAPTLVGYVNLTGDLDSRYTDDFVKLFTLTVTLTDADSTSGS